MSNKLVYVDDILARAHDVTLEGGAKHRCFDVTLLNELDTVTLQIGGRRNCKCWRSLDIEPVKPSKWIPKIVKIGGFEHEMGMKCERCGEDALNAEGDDFLTDYCPWCGAKMDKRKEEEEE